MGKMLELKDVNVYYGAIHAIKGISLEVNQGEIVTLIGANGAGKSTTLRTISGLLKPKSGTITFAGNNIAGSKAHEIVHSGIRYRRGVASLPRCPSWRISILEPLPARIKRESKRISSMYLSCSHALKSARTRLRGRCLAVSSRCWRWGVRL